MNAFIRLFLTDRSTELANWYERCRQSSFPANKFFDIFESEKNRPQNTLQLNEKLKEYRYEIWVPIQKSSEVGSGFYVSIAISVSVIVALLVLSLLGIKVPAALWFGISAISIIVSLAAWCKIKDIRREYKVVNQNEYFLSVGCQMQYDRVLARQIGRDDIADAINRLMINNSK